MIKLCGMAGLETLARHENNLTAMLQAVSYRHYRPCTLITGRAVALGAAVRDPQNPRLPPPWYEGDDAIVIVRGYVLPTQGTPHQEQHLPEIGTNGAWHPARYVHDRYVRAGASALEELDGTFQVSIWDKRHQRLILATDRFGLQPLYYARVRDGLVFATELKAVICNPEVKRNLDREAVADFFAYGFVLGDKSFVQDVRLLKPATILTYDHDTISERTYWQLTYPDAYPQRDDAWYDELIWNALTRTIKRMIEPERHYGVALSGGLDTRWIVALLHQAAPATLAMTFGVPECDDVRLARQVVQQLGVEHIRIELCAGDIIAQTGEIVHITDGMYNVLEAHEFPLSQAQPDYVDTSVGGFLGGQLFGYNLTSPRTALLTPRSTPGYVYQRYRAKSLPDGDFERLFGQVQWAELSAAARQSLQDTAARAPSDVPANIIDFIDFTEWERRYNFVGQLLKQDCLDARYPFSHRHVVEAALQLPPAQRRLERAYCRAFSRYFPSLSAIPWAATMLPPSAPPLKVALHHYLRTVTQRLPARWLPDRVGDLYLRKRQYCDYPQWMAGDLGQHIKSVLLAPDSDPFELFDRTYLNELVDAQINGRRDLRFALGLLLAFSLWSRAFAGQAPPHEEVPVAASTDA